MCDYKILTHNQNGYIILCNTCLHYQLAFGTTAATFESADFRRFVKQVANLRETSDYDGFEKQKRFTLDLCCKNAMMVVCYSELVTLNELLQEAVFSDELEHLFQDLNVARE